VCHLSWSLQALSPSQFHRFTWTHRVSVTRRAPSSLTRTRSVLDASVPSPFATIV
jgi:hypothetical protein